MVYVYMNSAVLQNIAVVPAVVIALKLSHQHSDIPAQYDGVLCNWFVTIEVKAMQPDVSLPWWSLAMSLASTAFLELYVPPGWC